MIQRLIDEGLLLEINWDNVPILSSLPMNTKICFLTRAKVFSLFQFLLNRADL
jgi:hypothetical protein